MTDIREIPLKKLVSDWVDNMIDLYYCDMALKVGHITYKDNGKPRSIQERRDVNQGNADKIMSELSHCGKTISDLAAVVEIITDKKLDN